MDHIVRTDLLKTIVAESSHFSCGKVLKRDCLPYHFMGWNPTNVW